LLSVGPGDDRRVLDETAESYVLSFLDSELKTDGRRKTTHDETEGRSRKKSKVKQTKLNFGKG
jgi:hypothetical protein